MKTIKIFFGLALFLLVTSCTKDFDKINTNPTAITKEEASGKYFITKPQIELFAPGRFSYWRAQLIHADRYAGYFTFGFNGSWWSGATGYRYHGGYTDATWGWISGYLTHLDNFMKLTEKDGLYENQYMYATGLIMKSLYYQIFTDIYGEVPYSEAGNADIALPKFDSQKDIYKGILADLDRAMEIIGDTKRTGPPVDDLGKNDLFCGGDLQKWKRFANTLKLRIALRAHGAPGDDFSENTIKNIMAKGLFLETEGDNILIKKDAEINQWESTTYGDIWHNFRGKVSKWHVGEVLVNYLRDNNDPRLSKYAQPAEGIDTMQFVQPKVTDEDSEPHDFFFERVKFIKDKLAHVIGNTDFYEKVDDTLVSFYIPKNKYYIGQPSRLSGGINEYTAWEFFSKPSQIVIQKKNEGEKIFGELVLTTAESYFLRAEAAVRGLSSENAQELFEKGITHAMKLWQIFDGEIKSYIATADLAKLTGTTEEKIEKINIQRWIALYTDGFEGWSVIRKSGYPKQLADDMVNDHIFYIGGDIGAKYPQRLRYGSGAYNTNGTNLQEAIGRQGADYQTTKVWWAKK